ncbi:alpha/beta hydrolase [Microbulbifer epialgicus]|uniref:Alpha/beta hydrolase n=1 Tax=Microbulbifer epialgicus TaxID=393907 RepID=A0ABV4NY04_9GAMM
MKVRINLYTLLAAFMLYLAISACSKRVASLIERTESLPFNEVVTTEEIEDLRFMKYRYCLVKKENCISYYYGLPLIDNNLQYSVNFEENGREHIVSLDLSKNSLGKKYSGTVILLHGFRHSKEFMLYASFYFRFLGFQVIVPDLLGHGDSEGRLKYGVDDSEFINDLIDNLIKEGTIKERNLYIVGYSMGALTAAHVSASRADVSGIVLLAPILSFDQAIYNYAMVSHPILSRLIPGKDIRKGAKLALKKSNIDPNDTRILPLIKSSKIPVLLISSDSDTISPYSNYKDLKQKNIKVIELEKRDHLSMVAIGEVEHEAIIRWLNMNIK